MKVVVGIGCDRNTAQATLEQALDQALTRIGASRAMIAALASIDKKNDEVALLALAQKNGWQLHFYRADELAAVEVPNPSETVRKYMGTPAVSEAAALLAARADKHQLLLEKYKYRGSDGKNATISIARIPAAARICETLAENAATPTLHTSHTAHPDRDTP